MSSEKLDFCQTFYSEMSGENSNVCRRTGDLLNKMSGEAHINFAYSDRNGIIANSTRRILNK